MRTPVFSLLLLMLLLPLAIAFSSPKPEVAEGQRDHQLPAERHPRGRRQECKCEDILQHTHGVKRVRVAKPPGRQCPCDRLKYKRKKAVLGRQKHWRQRCLKFLKQCQLQKINVPL